MDYKFSDSILNTPKSFIREILKVVDNPEIISFAGGLPNKEFFPVEEIRKASDKVLSSNGKEMLQYTTSDGYKPLREYIAARYKSHKGIEVAPEDILIVNGSQQALDLIGKVFINRNDPVIIEKPGYLGAIQAFSIFMPTFVPVELEDDGISISGLEQALDKTGSKLFYSVPNFQNPTGLTYSQEKREKVAEVVRKKNCVIVEDDPYGELRFIGHDLPPIKKFAPDNSVLMGSFSKIAAPGLRLGWVAAPKPVLEKLTIAKQAADLHSGYFAQRVLFQYLVDNNIDDHIKKIKEGYRKQRTAMVDALKKYMPKEVTFTEPEGGMFLWVSLPKGCFAMDLFDLAIKRNVAFVPGEPFYIGNQKSCAMRLNYTCSDPATIERGIKELATAVNELMTGK